ncbi:TPA: glycosyltransferase, partial [Escherichia coli]
MKNLLITIIVASYNSKDYILETLESCINQQYQNIEII